MATHVGFEFSSPSKAASSPIVRRANTPSPEKHARSIAFIRTLNEAEHGSPKPEGCQLISRHEFILGYDPTPSVLTTAASIDLPFPIVADGELIMPETEEERRMLFGLFPTTTELWMTGSFFIICVETLPPRPWPLTIGGYPLHITTATHMSKERDDPIDRGDSPRCLKKVLMKNGYQRGDIPSLALMSEMVDFFKSLDTTVHEIMSFQGCFRIVVSDDADMKILPSRIAGHAIFYKFFSDEPAPDPSSLCTTTPDGLVRDDHNYLADGNTLLRPGMMVSSSLLEGKSKSTTSGILVADGDGNLFVTVAAHAFHPDGEVWHPDPTGILIGTIVHTMEHADISLVRLRAGLRYVNQTFGTSSGPGGIPMTGLASGVSPERYNQITMNNPFSGYMVGIIIAMGVKILGQQLVQHQWFTTDDDIGAVDGSCGSAILDEEGVVVGFFRYQRHDIRRHCYAVSAAELAKGAYKICKEERTF